MGNYPRLDITRFGKILLETGDLDPVYIMLHGAQKAGLLDDVLLKRWLLAYWCFYNVGVASYIAARRDYWQAFKEAYYHKWPRGAERRYFRGPKSLAAIEWLERKSALPEAIVSEWAYGTHWPRKGDPKFSEVKERVKKAPLFGDWIAFKVADMLERCVSVPINFSDCHLDIYKDPRQGAALYLYGDWQRPIDKGDLETAVDGLNRMFAGFAAPPTYDREFGLQEAETVLCKYKSHVKGSYPLGKDTREVREALADWGQLAVAMIQYLPGEK